MENFRISHNCLLLRSERKAKRDAATEQDQAKITRLNFEQEAHLIDGWPEDEDDPNVFERKREAILNLCMDFEGGSRRAAPSVDEVLHRCLHLLRPEHLPCAALQRHASATASCALGPR